MRYQPRRRRRNFRNLLAVLILFAIFDRSAINQPSLLVESRPISHSIQLLKRKEDSSVGVSFPSTTRSRKPIDLDLSKLSNHYPQQQTITSVPVPISTTIELNHSSSDVASTKDTRILKRPCSACKASSTKSEDDDMTETPMKKRGGKGMNRHLIAASLSASIAVTTAGLSLFSNSLKAHDQDEYGVSRKGNLGGGGGSGGKSAKGGDGGKEGDDNSNNEKKNSSGKADEDVDDDDDDDDDEPGSPGSPTTVSNTTIVNNYNFGDQQQTSLSRREAIWGSQKVDLGERDREEGEEREDKQELEEEEEEEEGRLYKRFSRINMKKYDHWAPLLEKVEDYGKVTAAVGALAAAMVMTYASARAHLSYKDKDEEKKKEEAKKKEKEKEKEKKKGERGKGKKKKGDDADGDKDDDDDDKTNGIQPRDWWDMSIDADSRLMPSVLLSSTM